MLSQSKPNYRGKKAQHRNSEYKTYDYHMEYSGQMLGVCKLNEYLHQKSRVKHSQGMSATNRNKQIISADQPV